MTAPKRLIMSSQSAAPLSGQQLCDWPILTSRAAGLLSLSIDDDDLDTDPGPPFYFPRDMNEFRDFCCAATKLQQLALSSPPIEKGSWDYLGGFDDFLVSTYISSKLSR